MKTMRERTAVLVFVVLLIGGFCLCAAYILGFGRGLNVAASTIDEVAGELGGYTAIVYDGLPRAAAAPAGDAGATATEPGASASDPASASASGFGSSSGSGSASASAGGVPREQAVSGWRVFLDRMNGDQADKAKDERKGEEKGKDKDEGKGEGEGVGDASSKAAAAAEAGDPADADAQSDAGDPGDAAVASDVGSSADPDATASSASDAAGEASGGEGGSAPEEPLTLDELRASYLDKAASCFVLNVQEPTVYDQRTVIRSGSHRFGIMHVGPGSDPAQLAKMQAAYELAGVDILIVVADSLEDVARVSLASKQAVAAKGEGASATAKADGSSSDGNAKDSSSAADSADGPAAKAAGKTTDKDDANSAADAKDAADAAATTPVFLLEDVDIVVSLADEGLPDDGAFHDGTYFVDVPTAPRLGAIVVSPSKTYSSRVVD